MASSTTPQPNAGSAEPAAHHASARLSLRTGGLSRAAADTEADLASREPDEIMEAISMDAGAAVPDAAGPHN